MADKPQCVVTWTVKGVPRVQYPTSFVQQDRLVRMVKAKYNIDAKVDNPHPKPKAPFPRKANADA